MNRELWLTSVAQGLEPIFRAKGFPLRSYRLTCGWPMRFATGKRSLRVGECHSHQSSKQGVNEIFISPLLDDPLDVAGIVSHELLHAAVGVDQGHKGQFVKAMQALGLVGKPTVAKPGDALNEKLTHIIEQLGPYPHAKLAPAMKDAKPSRDVSLKCACGCAVRISLKWLEECGPPVCGCGGTFEPKE